MDGPHIKVFSNVLGKGRVVFNFSTFSDNFKLLTKIILYVDYYVIFLIDNFNNISLINWNCMKESDIEIPKIVRDKA